jgi:hypothetical protein
MKRMKLVLPDGAAVLIAHPWKGTVTSEIRTNCACAVSIAATKWTSLLPVTVEPGRG